MNTKDRVGAKKHVKVNISDSKISSCLILIDQNDAALTLMIEI